MAPLRNWIKFCLGFLLPGDFPIMSVASLTRMGQTVRVGNVSYYLPALPVSIIENTNILNPKSCRSSDDLVPLTVIDDTSKNRSIVEFESSVSKYLRSDDVFQIDFLQTILFKSGDATPGLFTSQYGTHMTLPKTSATGNEDLPQGPYIFSVCTGEVYRVFRLYSDHASAFTESLIQHEDGSFEVLSAAVPGAALMTVGLPSRLYFTRSITNPLAGIRLGVKDVFDITGIKTGCGSRQYYELYDEANRTATAVQKLLDAGAIIVGKLKTSQFANGEYATADWVDYVAPFNSRGDGYQDPGSSSAGPGAAIGAYPWLDIALGTDTGGSIRIPADVNGVYGNRPSYGMVAMDYTMPLSPDMDTAGILTRDPIMLQKAGYALYGELESVNTFPKKLFTVDFPTHVSTDADRLLVEFANSLGELLDTIPEALDVEAAWRSTGPEFARGSDLEGYIGQIFPILTSKQQVALVADKFFTDYGQAHDGRHPFVDPSPLLRWRYGRALPASTVNDALSNMTVFGQWWRTTIQTADNLTCSNSVLIYIGSSGDTGYRNGPYPITAPGIPKGYGIDRVPSFAGTPDIVVPIGQVVYSSTVSQHEEYLPVTVDMMAAKGCDGMLYDLILRLKKAGILPDIDSGV